MRRVTMVVVMTAVALSLTACGRKGRLIPPEDSVSRQYPNIQFPPSPGSAETLPEGPESTTR